MTQPTEASMPAVSPDPWLPLRSTTQARIGLGLAGRALPTHRLLELRRAHALARDAVHGVLDVDALVVGIRTLGLAEPCVITSAARTRIEYLTRPDLGRIPRDMTAIPRSRGGVGLLLCDGLSPQALSSHGLGLLQALIEELSPAFEIPAPVVATNARVALGDHVAVAMGVETIVVVIGERPGLSVPHSLGVYLTHHAHPGRDDSQRNCVSNIHPPHGLSYRAAARSIASLLVQARALGRSGVEVKDHSIGRSTDIRPDQGL